MISLADASASPRAMVIMHFNARLAVTAMKRPRWSVYIACFTLGAADLHSIHNSNVFNLRSHVFTRSDK